MSDCQDKRMLGANVRQASMHNSQSVNGIRALLPPSSPVTTA